MILKLRDIAKDKVVIVSQKQIASECRFVNQIPYKKGQIMWEFNTITGKLNEAEFEDSRITFQKDIVLRKILHKIVMRKDCYYVSALNQKNAFRKLNNHFE